MKDEDKIVRSAVVDCIDWDGEIQRPPGDPCWPALLLAAARDKRVQVAVIRAAADWWTGGNLKMAAELRLAADCIERGEVVLQIGEGL